MQTGNAAVGRRRRFSPQPHPQPQPPSQPIDFQDLVRTHGAALAAAALRLCGDPTEAHDLVQDTFERALRSRDRLVPGSARAWLFTILRNRFIDAYRQKRRGPRAANDDLVRIPSPEPEHVPAWAEITTAEIEDALLSLPAEYRSVYRLHAVDGRSYEEIARHLSIPRPTVGTRLFRARRALRALLLERLPRAD